MAYPYHIQVDNQPLVKQLNGDGPIEDIPQNLQRIHTLRSWINDAKWIRLTHIAGVVNPADILKKIFGSTKLNQGKQSLLCGPLPNGRT